MIRTITPILALIFITTNIFAQTKDSVNMNPNYAMDVFYSLDDDITETESSSDWTVAFSTGAQTASIYINDGKKVDLYETTQSISDFDTALDTTGLSSNWTKIYNDYNDWKTSAFEFGAVSHPDYGWGEYNQGSNILNGSKVFVLKTSIDNYYKVSVLKKEAGSWYYRYASLDNSFDTTIIYKATDFADRNFVYLNMDDHKISNREPVKTEWDMLFTQYYDTDINYIVSGVLLNTGIEAIEINGVNPSEASYTGQAFDANTKIIGSDWKSFDPAIPPFGAFAIDTAKTFFVKQQDGDIYKVNFTRFDGSTTGKVGLTKEKVVVSSVNEIKEINTLSLYPNPAKNNANLIIDANKTADISYSIYNLVGKQILQNQSTLSSGMNILNIDISSLNTGLYLVQIQNGVNTETLKLNIAK